jgi:hypothetical protein
VRRHVDWHWRVGRLFVAFDPFMANWPTFSVDVDGELVMVGFSLSNGTSDPLLLIDYEFRSHRISELIWGFRSWCAKRKGQ